MKKKVFSLMMTLLLAFVGVAKAELVVIGDAGTSTSYYIPFNSLYNYSFTEVVYPASEIGTAGTINSISFYLGQSNTSAAQTNSIVLFMKNVSRSTFASNTDFETVTSGDIVFSGSWTIPMNYTGWVTINLDTPFAYDGTSNLMVAMDENTGDYSTRYFTYVSVTNCGIQGYSDSYDPDPYNMGSYSGSKALRSYMPKTQLDITAAGGGGGATNQLFALQYDEDLEEWVEVDTIKVGPRPNGYWMEPFTFQIRNTGAATTITHLDWTPQEYFTLVAPELPADIAHDEDKDVQLTTGESDNTDWQMVAIYGNGRTAAVWNITAEPYDAQTPDVWEMACTEATSFPFVEVPATAHNATLYNNYTLPFPEIPEGYDAVYKLEFANDMMLDAEVTSGADGKVALYTADFYGEGGPMANNNYQGPTAGAGGGGGAAGPFQAMVGDETSTYTTGYLPMYYLYDNSLSTQLYLATELAAAGATTSAMNSIGWYSESTYAYNIQNVSIWMANVTTTEASATSPLGSGMTLVYQGNFQEVVGWNEFVFNQGSFAWDGTSNVLVMVQMNNGDWGSSIQWKAYNTGLSVSSYTYRDNTGYNAGTESYSMTTSNYRANTMFKSTGRSNRDLVDFESGNLPAGWDASQGYNDWYVDEEDYYGYAPAYAGTYSLYVDGNGAYDNDYFVSPATEFAGAGSLSFAYATPSWSGDQNDLSVGYSTSQTGPWTIFPAANELQSEDWQTVNLDLSSLNGTYYIAFISYDGYGYCTAIDNINLVGSSSGGGQGGGGTTPAEISYGPVITAAPVEAGTYYLVASSTDQDFEVTINAVAMPCPQVDGFAFNEIPADDEDEIEPASVTLQWTNPAYATSCQVFFGSTYYPEPSHPQTVISDVMPVNGPTGSFTVTNLWNNTNYFWYVVFYNEGACQDGAEGPHWGFTTHLNVPQNLTAVDETVFNDETITLNWTAVVDRTYRQYNVYRDGQLIGHTTMNDISNTTYTDGPLAYNMTGYVYYVTAVYDEGESAPSNTVTVKVSGRGNVNGHVYEQDGTTGIANATVTMVGEDEFGDSHTYNFTTDNQGYYTGTVYAGTYNGSASCNGYQTINEPIQGNPINITYDQTTSPVDYMLDENFDPVCQVIAEYYPDSLDPNSPYVKVYWGCGLPGGEIVEPFETGDFSLFDWNITGNYPWEVTTSHPYEGTYCMRSTNYNVASSTSSIDVTVDIPADGIMSFFGYISSEANWDYGYFYIDGVQKGSYTGAGNSWGEKKFDITEGTHNFKWEYTKDGSLNNEEDRFYVDYISFYKQPEPAQPGWHTYCESEFNNAVGSNLTTTPSWAYEYPASFLHANYAGWNITKVSLFSDNMYSAVGGNYTCRIYVGGTQPAAGTMVSELTVDVPSNQNAWVDWDLTTPVSVTGNDPIWVVWTANSTVSSWPAGCCGDLNDLGTWWDGGEGWEHLTYGTWTMRHWFTNRAGRSVVLSTANQNNLVSKLNSNLRTPVKGEESNAICANENAVKGAAIDMSNTRRFSHYRVYRTDCYNDGPYTLLDEAAGEFGNTRVLSCELYDTVYIDTYWNDPQFTPAGVYKWGVGVVYVGNRGEEYESEIVWATPTVNGTRNRDQVYDFEDGQIPAGWTNSAPYPWTVSSDSPTGSYCIKSSNSGVASSTSSIQTTVDFAEAGTVSFDALCQGEGTSTFWDHCDFSIDGTVMLTAGANVSGWNHYSFPVAAGSHTFMWSYTKDSSVNPTGDAFSVDNVAFSGNGGGGGGGGGQGGQPGTEPVQEPRESVIVWSNCLDKDMYLDGVTVTVLLNSADSPEGTTVTFTNTNEYEQQTFGGYDLTLDESGYYAFETFRRGEYNISVRHEGYEPIDETRLIWDNEDLRYVMMEILYGVENIYVSRTGWAMWDDSHNNPGGGGGGGGQGGGTGTTSFTDDFENGLSNWNAIDADGDGNNWYHSSQSMTYACYDYTGWGHNESDGFAVSSSYTDCTYDSYDPNNFLVTNQKYSIVAGSTLNFWADYGNDSYPDHFGVAVATADNPTPADFTIVWEGNAKNGDAGKSQIRHNGDRYFNWRSHSVDLSAYAGQDVYIAFRHFNSYDQYEIYIDDVTLTTGAKNTDEMMHFEYYKVMCTSIDGVPIYNHNTVYPFCQLSTNEPYNAPLVEGEHYLCKVATVYSTGMSAWSEPVEWEYEPCDHWGPVDEVTVEPNGEGNLIEWTFEHGFNPYDPGTGGGGGGGQASFEWYYYDNGVNEDAIGTGGGQFWWAVMFPAGSYEGHQVSKVAAYDYMAMTGTASIYQGGSNAPAGNALGQTNVTLTGSEDFVEFNFAAPVAVDPAQNLWVVFYNASGATYPAAVCANTGDANGRWVSLDGATWEDMSTYGLDYTFMLRAYIGDGAKGNYYDAPAQTVSGMVSNDVYVLNITDFATFDERVFVAYNLVNDSRFNVVSEGNGTFIISLDNAYESSLKEAVTDFLNETSNRFSAMDKEQAAETTLAYKSSMSMELTNALMMDVYVKSRENNMCEFADPFCTDNGMYEFPAGVNAGSGEAGPDYDCLYTTPNPAWYYMRMGSAGGMDIYMYSTPAVDIDFCCWGPFEDPTTPCPYGLTEDKVVSCSYSANPTEHCIIPDNAQVGEYYILVITNYSNQTCNINFSAVAGAGTTDCGILPPVDIIGFLITMDGEYLAFAGPTDRDFLHEGEYGEHEYCVRPIYPGEMELPSNNFGWSMGCPVCTGGGGEACEAGAPIHGEALDATDQVKVWWGEQEPGPGCEGDEFTVDFEAGLPTGWTTIDADGDGYNWNLASTTMGTGYGHNGSSDMMFSQSYDNNYGALTPDNWLVSPAVTLCENSTFSFFACAQDNAWASEHFGVAVTDDDGAFQMVQEWTMTAKGEPYDGPRGMRDQGNWYQYTVDLGAYAGEGRQVAIRHFNCTDWFYLDIDDIQLTAGAKATRDGIVKYNVYRSTENANYTLIGEVPAVAGQTYYEYIDTPAGAGSYYYQVTAVYADCESEPAASYDTPANNYVVVGVTGVDENGGMAIFPNPTKGNVTIQAAGMQHITVVSVLGQVVYDADVTADELILNMSQFTAGMYTVRVTTENGVHVERITVIR